MDPRTRRSPARFLAPLALIIAIIAFFAVISASGGNGSSSSNSTSSNTTSQTTTTSTTTKTRKKTKTAQPGTTTTSAAGPSTYTVKVGDTLGGIAAKTGIPLSKIQELNPDVDPHAMVAGQQIKLK